MNTLLECDIPLFVKDSPFLQSMLNNGSFTEQGIEVPCGCAKKELSITNAEDLRELLQTLRYWIVPDVLETCKDFFIFAFNEDNRENVLHLAAEFSDTIPLVERTAQIASTKKENQMEAAISSGVLSVVQYLHSLGEKWRIEWTNLAVEHDHVHILQFMHKTNAPWDSTIYRTVAECGGLNSLIYLIENNCPELEENMDFVLKLAARHGHLPIIEFLWDRCADWRTSSSEWDIVMRAAQWGHVTLLRFAYARSFQCFTTPDSCLDLMFYIVDEQQGGHADCLQFLCSVGQVPTADIMFEAAAGGHLQCLRVLREFNCPQPTENLCRQFACRLEKGKYFDCLKCAQELGLTFDADIMTVVAYGGHFEPMKFLHEQGCPWDTYTCVSAARWGHLACLRFAHENGAPWNKSNEQSIGEAAAQSNTLDCLKYVIECGVQLSSSMLLVAAGNGNADIIEYLIARKCPRDGGELIAVASTFDDAEALTCTRLLHAYGCPWHAEVCQNAVKFGLLNILKYAHQHGCPWDETTYLAAIMRGSLTILRYAYENGCPWNEVVCAVAAEYGEMEILQFAHEHGCPWDASTCTAAAKAGSMKCLQYAHEHGCPWDAETYRAAERFYNDACLEYMQAHGCPRKKQDVR